MIAGVVSKDFGLLASDSAMYDTSTSTMSFQTLKLYNSSRFLLTFIGTPAYFSKLDRTKLDMDLPSLSIYMESYLKDMRPVIEKMMKSEIADKDENQPHFCLLALGLHKKLPTIAQFNSYTDFKPKYLFSDGGPKFSTILFGDDARKKVFQDSTTYMEKKWSKWEKKGMVFSPGVAAELLTRGIYKSSDFDAELGLKQKFSGGAVSVGGILNTGLLVTLTGLTPA